MNAKEVSLLLEEKLEQRLNSVLFRFDVRQTCVNDRLLYLSEKSSDIDFMDENITGREKMKKLKSLNEQKLHLCHLILQVNAIYGANNGDSEEKEQLRQYCKEVIQLYREKFGEAILCFESLIQQAKDCSWIKYSYSSLDRFMETHRAQALPK